MEGHGDPWRTSWQTLADKEGPPPRGRFILGSLAAALLLTQACGASSPTSPSTLQVLCPISPSLLVGQSDFCYPAQGGVLVDRTQATWSTSDPTIARLDLPGGHVIGAGAGQVVISALYMGQTGSITLTVVAKDWLDEEAVAFPGVFKQGATVVITAQGSYGVASADTGQLSLVITDQTGAVVNIESQTVSRGGGSYLLKNTFTVPATATQVCQVPMLQVGGTTISATVNSSLHCFAVTQ